MRRRWMWIGMAVLLVGLAGGGIYYVRARPLVQTQRPRDPAFALLLSIRVLEGNPRTRLSREQIARILPFVKALKDVPLSDAEVVSVIARTVREAFTFEQRAALEDARRRFEERRRSGGGAPGAAGGGEGGAPDRAPAAGGLRGTGGAGSGLTDEQRAQARTRAFERMIRYLERRMR